MICQTIILIVCMLVGYCLGSINFAIIVTRLFGKGDIRQYGSGNAGMTNVLRTVGKSAAALTLLGDFSKGILSVLLLRLLFWGIADASTAVWHEYLVAYAALLGHVFPVFYGFRGGKGILVSAGSMLILSPRSLLICLAGFLIVTLITRYISAGSITAAILYPFANLFVFRTEIGQLNWTLMLLAIPISLLVIYLHRENIRRLANGTERKVSLKKNRS